MYQLIDKFIQDSKEMDGDVQAREDVPRHRQLVRQQTRLGGTDGTPCSDRTLTRLNTKVILITLSIL